MIKIEADGGIGSRVLTRLEFNGADVALLQEADGILAVICQTFAKEGVLGGMTAEQLLELIVRGARAAITEVAPVGAASTVGFASVRVPDNGEEERHD